MKQIYKKNSKYDSTQTVNPHTSCVIAMSVKYVQS